MFWRWGGGEWGDPDYDRGSADKEQDHVPPPKDQEEPLIEGIETQQALVDFVVWLACSFPDAISLKEIT